MQKLEVLIVGGGIGGLSLAQGLHKAGIQPQVFERDESPTARTQGYRIHISPGGSEALHDCLPPDLFKAFDETCGNFGQGFTMMSEHQSVILSLTGLAERVFTSPVKKHRSASRFTLKRILVSGLKENIHYSKRFQSYEELSNGRIRVHFEDGTTAEGDLLVGADGVNSPVRKQRLPDAGPIDTGVYTLGGKVPLTDGAMAILPDQLLDGPMLVMPNDACSLFLGLWKRPEDKAKILDKLPGAEQFAAEDVAAQDEDYVIFGFGAPQNMYGFAQDPNDLSKRELQDVLRRMVRTWHPNFRKLVELLDTDSIGGTHIRTSTPLKEWPTNKVTLLGDAIHSMTPYRGIGANVALKDAALLATKLKQVADGQLPLNEAVKEYETEMRAYSAKAVKESLDAMNQAMAEKKLGFTLFKAFMRLINRMPAVKRQAFARMADA